jgi:hypothetical protein
MLTVAGLFQVVAAFASAVPAFVHDRVPNQFVPVWNFLTYPVYGDAPNEAVVWALARISQVIIVVSEGAIGVTLLAAVAMKARRLALANFALAYASALYGAFLLTMFAMHDPDLPKWNQYPAILAWTGVIWLVAHLTDPHREQGPQAP